MRFFSEPFMKGKGTHSADLLVLTILDQLLTFFLQNKLPQCGGKSYRAFPLQFMAPGSSSFKQRQPFNPSCVALNY